MSSIDMPPPGFRGLDPCKPVRIYRRHLPHWRQDGATYFVTFRLADSLPETRLRELAEARQRWAQQHPDATDEERAHRWREERGQLEEWLDAGCGSCALARPAAAEIVAGAMSHFDGQRYALFSYIVMPNHVHVVLRPIKDWDLERVLGSWKKFSARRINSATGSSGELWQGESYDHIVRETPQLRRILRYMHKNEVQTGSRCKLWITPEWAEWWAIGGGT